MSETQEVIKYITAYCPHIGAFSNVNYVGNVFEFLDKAASKIAESPETPVFPDRTKEHVAYAVATVAHNPFLSSPSVLAAAYLVTRFEVYFRVLSGVLNVDGTWIGGTIPPHVSVSFGKLNKGNLNKKGISSVSTAYTLVKLNTSHKIAAVFDQLDVALASHWSPKITDIGERIQWVRHPTAHGELGDPSGEAVFYALLTALIFYNQM